MYLLLLLFGALGFLVMTFFGLAHGAMAGHHSAVGGHVPTGSHGHVALPSHGHLASGHAPAAHGPAHHNSGVIHRGHGPNPSASGALASKLLLAISPLDIFAMAVGAGAAGVLLEHYVGANALILCAVAGAFVFDFAIVKPLMGLLFRFVSKPSEGLEGQVATVADAITAFDRDGKGLVKLCLDGQIVQLLANLDASEKERGVSVAKGDQVVVVEVDAARNICKVSRELAPSLADDAAQVSSQAKGNR